MNTETAIAVRAVLDSHYSLETGAFNHSGFLTEMQQRSQDTGVKLTAKRQRLLAQIVAAYMRERGQIV